MTTAARTIGTINRAESAEQESQARLIFRRFRRHRLAVISTILILIVFGRVVARARDHHLPPRRGGHLHDRPARRRPARGTARGACTSSGLTIWAAICSPACFTRRASRCRSRSWWCCSSQVFGTLVGAVAGYYGGVADASISRVTEFMLSIPDLPILLIISAILIKREVILPLPPVVNKFLSGLMLAPEREAQKVVVLVLILMIFGWMGASRLMRGMALSLAKQDFVEALRAAGASDARIIFRHIIPNGLAPILVNASLALGGVIVLESALSFLALGVQEPTPTWGNMLSAISKLYVPAPLAAAHPGHSAGDRGHRVQFHRRRPARRAGSAIETIEARDWGLGVRDRGNNRELEISTSPQPLTPSPQQAKDNDGYKQHRRWRPDPRRARAEDLFLHRRRRGAGGQRRGLHHPRGRGDGPGRRVGLGQERDLALDHAPAGRLRQDRRRSSVASRTAISRASPKKRW